jgi:hypothetical protein
MVGRCMKAHSKDMETAFLDADLHEEIFSRQLKSVEDGISRVMRLLKSIYCMKQAFREWCSLFHTTRISSASNVPHPTPASTP